MSNGYDSVAGFIPYKSLTVVDPHSPNHLMTFGDQFGETCRNGPQPSDSIYASNQIEITSASMHAMIANKDIIAPAFTFDDVSAGPNDALSLNVRTINTGSGDKNLLYLGNDPVDTDSVGLIVEDPVVDHVLLIKNTDGTIGYHGEGGQAEAIIDQALAVSAYVSVGSKDVIIPGAVPSDQIYMDDDRMMSGNFPIIRSLATPGSMMGGGLIKNKIAVFANSDGDITPQIDKQPMDETDPEYDPDYPDDVETTEIEGPMEVTNPNENPDKPAMKVCQNSSNPTTVDICNEGSGGGQITFPGTPGNYPSITSTPSTGSTIAINVPTIGGAPTTAVAIPTVAAAGIAGAIPVAAAAAAAGVAGGAAAGVAAAAGALAGVAAGAGAIVGIGGIIAAPVVALTAVTGGLPPMPPGSLTIDPLNLDVLNGEIPLIGWKPNTTPMGLQSITTTPNGKIPTTPTGEIPTTESTSDPTTIGTANPESPASIGVPELIVESTTSPTILTLAGPCDKEAKYVWDCSTGTLQLVIVDKTDPENPSASVIQSWTETDTIINVLNEAGALNADCLTLSAQLSNPGSTPSTTIWLDSADVTRPKFGNTYLALASDIAGAGLTTDTNPIANELSVYADASGNRKSANVAVTLGKSLTVTGGLNTKPQANSSSDMIKLVPGTETQGGIIGMQALTGGSLGYSSINWNGYFTTNEQRFNTSKNRWRVGVDQRSTTDTFFIDTWNGTGGSTSILSADASSGYISINRGLTINLPNSLSNPIGAYGLSAGRMTFSFINGNAGIHRSSVQIGGNAQNQRWSFGNDYLENNSDDSVFIRRDATTPVYAMQASSSGFVTLPNGFASSRHDIISTSSNPGSTNTLWYNSADDASRLRFGSAKLALNSDIKTETSPIANELVVYADASGNKKTNGSSSVATLGGHGLQTKNLHFVAASPDFSVTSTSLYVDTSLRLKYGGTTVALISDVNALKSNFTLATQASNPGTNTTLWANSLDNGLMYGDSAVVNINTLVSLMGTEEWSGNWSLSTSTSISPTNIPVTVSKVRNQVVVKLSATLNITALGASTDAPQQIIVDVGSMPDRLYPADETYVRYVGAILYTVAHGNYTEKTPDMRWDTANNEFKASFIQPGDQIRMYPCAITYLS